MINVVIADDEPLALIELKSLIPWEEHGFRITGEFRNGKSALDFLMEHPETDLAILDINMPAMSGLQVIEERNRLDIPVEYVVVSAYSDYPLVRNAFKMGISDYIIKEELEAENLLPVLEKIASRIEKRKVTRGERPASSPGERDQIFSFLSGTGEVPEAALFNNPDQSISLMKLELLHCRRDSISIESEALICFIEEMAGKTGTGALCLEHEQAYYLLLPLNTGDSRNGEKISKLEKTMKHRVKQYFNKLLIVSGLQSDYSTAGLPKQFQELKSLHSFRSRSIRRCLDYIQENYRDSEISFEDLCALTETSRSYLSSLFKQETGIGYKDYLNEVRISHAISLLENTDIKVQDVSDQVGFSNVEHFSRTFKNRTGLSPSQYSRSRE